MLTLRAIQAHEGDCLILLYGDDAAPRALLCDGGPKDTYRPFLRNTLEGLNVAALDAVVLSHVDRDHVIGLLDFFADLRNAMTSGRPPLIDVRGLWLNAFDATEGRNGVQSRLANAMQQLAAQAAAMAVASAEVNGIEEGHKLNGLATRLDIPVNELVGGGPFIADGASPLSFHGLSIRVVGPTQANLDALGAEWEKWLAKVEGHIGRGDVQLAAMADKSIPNLSSIQLLVEAGGKRILLTGDGRGDHLLEALEEGELLDADESIDLDLLKVPHHGSDRNVTRGFFERVQARTYVISADGKNDNPDFPTLQWIVQSRPRTKPITIVVTNRTDNVDRLEGTFPPSDFGYTLRVRSATSDFIDVEL